MLFNVNILSVLLATVLAYLLGWFWFSQKGFGKMLVMLCSGEKKEHKHSPLVFILSFVLMFIAAFVFAAYLDAYPTLWSAIVFSLVIGIFWVGTSLGVHYLFAGKPLMLFLIDAGYYAAVFLIYGVVLGLWR